MGNLAFLLFNGEAGTLLWSGTVGSPGPFCALGKQVSWYPQNVRLPLSGGAGFQLFDWALGALPQESLHALCGEKPSGTLRRCTIAKHGV
jgi:hypothetical protein